MTKRQDLKRIQLCVDILKNVTEKEFLELHKENGIDLDAPFTGENHTSKDSLKIYFPEMKAK